MFATVIINFETCKTFVKLYDECGEECFSARGGFKPDECVEHDTDAAFDVLRELVESYFDEIDDVDHNELVQDILKKDIGCEHILVATVRI